MTMTPTAYRRDRNSGPRKDSSDAGAAHAHTAFARRTPHVGRRAVASITITFTTSEAGSRSATAFCLTVGVLIARHAWHAPEPHNTHTTARYASNILRPSSR